MSILSVNMMSVMSVSPSHHHQLTSRREYTQTKLKQLALTGAEEDEIFLQASAFINDSFY